MSELKGNIPNGPGLRWKQPQERYPGSRCLCGTRDSSACLTPVIARNINRNQELARRLDGILLHQL